MFRRVVLVTWTPDATDALPGLPRSSGAPEGGRGLPQAHNGQPRLGPVPDL